MKRRKSDTTRWDSKTCKDTEKKSRRRRMRFSGSKYSKESWSKLNNYQAKKKAAAVKKMSNLILCKPKLATVVLPK